MFRALENKLLHRAIKKDPKTYIKAKFFLLILAISLLTYIVFTLLFSVLRYKYGVIAGVIGITGILISIYVLKKKGSLKTAALFIILLSYVVFSIYIFTSGGISSPTIPWLITLPAAAFIFISKKSGYWISILVILTVTFAFLIKLFGFHLPALMPQKSLLADMYFSLVGVIIYVFLLFILQDTLLKRQSYELAILLKENQEKQQELLQQQEEIAAQRDALEESQKRLATILELLPDAVLIIDDKGKVTHWNKALERLTGVKAEEIVGKGNYEYALPFYGRRRPILIDLAKEPTDYLRKHYKNITVEGNILKAESYVPALRGEERYLIGIATALYDNDGNYLGAIEVIHDITDIKHAQEVLKERNEELEQQKEEIMVQRDALQESEERIRTILESLPDAAFVINREGKVVYWNRAIEKMTGVPAQNMVGKGDYEYAVPFYGEKRPILIDLVKEPSEYLRQNYKSISIEEGKLKAESYVPNLRGKEHYLIGVAAAIYDAKGEYAGAIEIIHDITPLKRAQEEIERKQKEITDSINYAKYIQQTILPTDKFMQMLLKDYFVLYKPRDIVSGDFYWIRKIAGKLIVAVADCTGHGVPGALVSMLGLSFLNDITKSAGSLQPDRILDRLRLKIKKAFKQTGQTVTQKDGMDIALAVIDVETLQLEFAGAYNPLYVFRKTDTGETQLFKLMGDRQPAAVYIKEKPFTKKELQLQPGDTLYMFSDGYADQFGPKGKLTIKRFRKLLSEIYDKPMDEQKQLLEQYLQQWQQNYNQIDDILVLGFKV